jgi:hypothetical protein
MRYAAPVPAGSAVHEAAPFPDVASVLAADVGRKVVSVSPAAEISSIAAASYRINSIVPSGGRCRLRCCGGDFGSV